MVSLISDIEKVLGLLALLIVGRIIGGITYNFRRKINRVLDDAFGALWRGYPSNKKNLPPSSSNVQPGADHPASGGN
jgi:hypothetical protein